jgi:hypothetical protein
VGSSKASVPANTSKPCGWNRSSSPRVCDQSPELSLIPATLSGQARSSRSMRPCVTGTCDTAGMWYRYKRNRGSATASMTVEKLLYRPSSLTPL